MSHIKRKIKNHLVKRRTNYSMIYFVFLFMVFVIGILNIVVQTDTASKASEFPTGFLSHKEESKEDNAVYGLFPRTKKEENVYKMIEKEDIQLSPSEKKYIEQH